MSGGGQSSTSAAKLATVSSSGHHHQHHTTASPSSTQSTNTSSASTYYPSPPVTIRGKSNSDCSRFTYSDLGYESLHSTPKSTLGTGGSESAGTGGKSNQCSSAALELSSSLGGDGDDCGDSAECVCLPEEEEEGEDDDDDESVELKCNRDPIRRRISLTTKENHSVHPKTSSSSSNAANSAEEKKKRKDHRRASKNCGGSNSSNSAFSSLRRCRFRRYLFKWMGGGGGRGEQVANKTLTIEDGDSELVEIHEEQLVVATTTSSTTPTSGAVDGGGVNGAGGLVTGGNGEVREEWGKKMDFLLSIIGFAVDLSNVWRFPYLCYKNGGGVFLIPYTIMLLFGALPLFFMELSLGQFAKSGPINIWDKICPPLKGIGYCFVLISWYVSFYYNVIIAWTTNYVIKTLISGDEMPWQHCGNSFNTKKCISMDDIRKQCGNRENPVVNRSEAVCGQLANRTSPTEEFFNFGLLQIDKADGFSNMGVLRPELVGCLIIVFITLYFSLFKGVKSSGKVVWVTATAPYFILTILLARGLFLPGALSGIKYYISPRMEMLSDPNVWVDAAVQVFYSIGVGFGVHLTYASFNKFNNNCYADCLVTASVNSLTSFYSGFVIFTYLGYMAHSMDKEIQNVASEGYGLVFQVYPEAISTLPFAKFWSILFFFMLLTLGIDSAMGGLEAVITGLMDEFRLHNWIRREVFTVIVICGSFCGALVNCTQGGGFTMVWFDTYSAGISLLCSAMFEALAVTYFYGIDKFVLDIESMIGHKPNWFFVISWKYVSPIFLSTVIIMSILNSETVKYYNYEFPFWATFSGWCFTLSSISAIPIYLIYWYCGGGQRRHDRLMAQKTGVHLVQMHTDGKGANPQTTTTTTDHSMLKNHYITGADAHSQAPQQHHRNSEQLNNSQAVFV